MKSYSHKALFELVQHLYDNEREYILRSLGHVNKRIRSYIRFLLTKAGGSDRVWQQRKGLSKSTMYKLRRTAFQLITDLLLRYYSEQDKIRKELDRAYLQASLSVRKLSLKEVFDSSGLLPYVDDYLQWGDKFPWYWAEYVFFNIYNSDRKFSENLFLTVGDSVSLELMYSFLLKRTDILVKRIGFPILRQQSKWYISLVESLYRTILSRKFNCSISLIKFLSYVLFIMLILRDGRAMELLQMKVLPSLIELLERIAENKNLHKTELILVSDICLITFPVILPLNRYWLNRLRPIIEKAWNSLHETEQASFAQKLSFLIKHWLFSYGFPREALKIRIKEDKETLPQGQEIDFPSYMFSLMVESWFNDRWEYLKRVIEELRTKSQPNFNRLLHYIACSIQLIETNDINNFSKHAIAFYQWARRNDFGVSIAKFFRKILIHPYLINDRRFWYDRLEDLKGIYSNNPLLANIEFYIPITIFLLERYFADKSKEEILKMYPERINIILNPTNLLTIFDPEELEHVTGYFVECISEFLQKNP